MVSTEPCAAPVGATGDIEMSTPSSSPSVNSPQDQREALAESEKNANENQFREENNDDKVVEIPPNKVDQPIRGLDPK
jgi:hypothetical protein